MALSDKLHPPLQDNSSATRVNMFPFSCLWNIDHFNDRRKTPLFRFQSRPFSVGDNVKFCLRVWSEKNQSSSEEYFSVALYLISCPDDELKVNARVSVRNANNLIYPFAFCDDKIKRSHSFDWRRIVLMENLTKMLEPLKDNTLTLFCDGRVFLGDNDTFGNNGNLANNIIHIPKCTALWEFGLLLDNDKYTDVTIYAKNDEMIHAHKAILAARSSVFAEIIDSNSKGGRRARIFMKDEDPTVVKELLRYIYTGTAPNNTNTHGSLLALANRFRLGRLKALCAEALSKTLTADNAARVLILAHCHGEPELKARVMTFIHTYSRFVVFTEGYKSMVLAYPILADELYRALARMQKSNSQEKNNEAKSE